MCSSDEAAVSAHRYAAHPTLAPILHLIESYVFVVERYFFWSKAYGRALSSLTCLCESSRNDTSVEIFLSPAACRNDLSMHSVAADMCVCSMEDNESGFGFCKAEQNKQKIRRIRYIIFRA